MDAEEENEDDVVMLQEDYTAAAKAKGPTVAKYRQ